MTKGSSKLKDFSWAWRIVPVVVLTLVSLTGAMATSVASSTASRAASPTEARGAVPTPLFVRPQGSRPMLTRKPPTESQCTSLYGVACYSVSQIRTAYKMPALYAKHDNGAGQTIVIVDCYGSPTIKQDLTTFDSATNGYDLPAPPSFNIIAPAGAIPTYNPANREMVGWATETTLDVEWAHAMAPGAKILLVETPVDETVGTAGFPQIVKAENYVVQHKLGNVISQSFGAAERTFPSPASINGLRSAYVAAAAAGVTVLAAAGDAGATNEANAAGTFYFKSPAVGWPASDPLVTAVGGTQLHLDAAGNRTAPDNVWNDTAVFGHPAAGGGGVSGVFSRPAYQAKVASSVGDARGVPDVSLNASLVDCVLINHSFGGEPAGWEPIAGTSEASPLFAGIVAIADQIAGHGLGSINPTLYKLGSGSLTDITKGNNTVSFTQSGKKYTVTGYDAAKGYDLASGLGTANGPDIVSALAAG